MPFEVETNRVNLEPRRRSYKAAQPIPHHSAHQGSPSGFGIAYRGVLNFESGSHDERVKARSEYHIVSRLQTAQAKHRLHNDLLFREPNINAA